MKRWVPRLALRKRLKVIRKWPIITFCVTTTFCVNYYILWRNIWVLMAPLLDRGREAEDCFFRTACVLRLSFIHSYRHPFVLCPSLGACNCHTKPKSRHFYRLVYLYILLTKREGRTGRISGEDRPEILTVRCSPNTVPSKLG